MQYSELKKQLGGFGVFSVWDIRRADPKFHRPQLNKWQEKGYLKKLRRGYYMFADTPVAEDMLFLAANELYAPSYVSLEMALSYYNLIPEGVYSVTSITTKKTAKFTTPIGKFFYRNVKPQLFFGYRLQSFGKRRYRFAEMEKAVLDYLYLNPKITRKADLHEWRFNGKEFLEKADMDKFARYRDGFQSASLTQGAERFLKFINGGQPYRSKDSR